MPLVRRKRETDASNAVGNAVTRPSGRKRIWGLGGGDRTAYLIIALVVVIACVIFGVAYYQQYVAPFRRVVIRVDDTVIRMGYFLDRARLSGSGGLATLQALTNEELIKRGAARFGIVVTPQDVDTQLRIMATGGENVTISEAEFKEWYRQLLYANKVSNARYREKVAIELTEARLREFLAMGIPPAVEHARVWGISVGTYDEAARVKERIDAGEDFSKVAREVSLDPSREQGGELDWMPRGVMVNNMDPFLLKVGEVSHPLAIVEDQNTPPRVYYVLLVSEIAVRDIKPEHLPDVRRRVFQDWLNEELKLHKIRWGGWDGKSRDSYGSTTDAWVNWQLSKRKS